MARAGARSVHGVRVDVQWRTRERARTLSENGAALEYLSGQALNCTPRRHPGGTWSARASANYAGNSRRFQPSRTVTREPARTSQIADGFVDSTVARFLN
jgi:hypothetical protein